MVTVHYRRWCPPQSPLRIEFPPELLRDVRLEGAEQAHLISRRWTPRFNRAVNQSSGLLFGVQHEDEVRVLAARSDENRDSIPDGLAPVGTFVCRARGEVFLTDDDLANFEKHRGILALVVAGSHAGFFVREPDGSVQAIRSHEEFPVADVTAHPPSKTGNAPFKLPKPAPQGWQPVWKRAIACAGLLTIPAGGFAYLRPLLPQVPIALALREEAGQLRIGWNAGALAEGSRLEITDGSERAILMLAAGTSSATYRPQGGDVEVRLSTGTRAGGAHWEAARFVTAAPRRTVQASTALRDRIGELTLEAQTLRRSLEAGQARTKELAARMDAMTDPRAARPAP